MDLRKQRIEIAVTSAILALTGYLQYVAYTTKVRTNVQGMQSMAFPKIILYVMMALCLVTLAGGIRKYRRLKKELEDLPEKQEKVKEPLIPAKVLISTGLIIVYALCWNWIGFLLSSVLFVFAESRLLDSSKPIWQSVAVAAGYTIIIYLIFSVGFGVRFPEPIFEGFLG